MEGAWFGPAPHRGRMLRQGSVLAIIQAGGEGSRLDVLTRERAKPALAYGGSHRLIDFALSAMVHAELDDVWVSVQYQVESIDEYLSGGRPWSLDRNRGGFRRMVPQTGTGTPTEEGFASGNADLMLKLQSAVRHHGAEHLVVVSADHVFNCDLWPIIEEHAAAGRAATLVTTEVPKVDARANVVVLADRDGRVSGLEVKPSRPSSGTIATEIFLYQTEALANALSQLRAELDDQEDGDDSGLGDFGDHLLPRLIETGDVFAVPLAGYWRDLGQPANYLEAHRDLVAGKVDVFDHPERPIISHWPDLPAARVRSSAAASASVLAAGCDVAGEVDGSVLGPGVVVEAGAVVRDSVLGEGTVVRAGAIVQTAIVDTSCEVLRGGRVGAPPRRRRAHDDEIVVVGRGCRISGIVNAGARLEPGTTAD